MKVGTRDRAPRFGLRLRMLFALARWLARVGLYPSVDKLRRLPPERRKAIKPAAWMTYPLRANVSIATETIAGRGGRIAMKLFATDGSAGRPALLFIHG